MSRLPIRLRLTLVFAAATIAVLVGAALFVGQRLRDDLDGAVTATLEGRAAGPVVATSEPEETFIQVLSPDGRVLRAAGGARRAALTPSEARATAAGRRLLAERAVPGLEGVVRVLAVPKDGRVVATGQSLGDRDEALDGLLVSFLLGGPVAVLVAGLLGYALASAALRPVEDMRRRAERVSLTGAEDELLPLPHAHDEIRRLGDTLNAMLVRLRAAFAREQRFVADASHELRTPIAVVKTELESAARAGGGLPPAAREALEAALAETDVLAQLTEDLLVLARSADGALPVRPEQLAVRDALERTAERFADRAAREGRAIELRAPADLTVRADPLRLRQALGNLVDNALRYGAGPIVLEADRTGDLVLVRVGDAGSGIPPELGDGAFERFARADAARTRGGSGLGLAIVRAIAEAHGGTAELDPERRATVLIRLPG